MYESSKTTTYLNDGQNPTGYSQVLEEVERDGSGTITRKVVYAIGLDKISQTTIPYTGGSPGTATTHFFGADGHGSTRVLLDLAAGIAQFDQGDANRIALGFEFAESPKCGSGSL